jgi:hypothetical protein
MTKVIGNFNWIGDVLPFELKEDGKGRHELKEDGKGHLLFFLLISLISFQVAFKSYFNCSNLSS